MASVIFWQFMTMHMFLVLLLFTTALLLWKVPKKLGRAELKLEKFGKWGLFFYDWALFHGNSWAEVETWAGEKDKRDEL